MLLATYQTYKNTESDRRDEGYIFEDFVGYCPIRCFRAETPEEFAFRSWFCSYQRPEKVILFEADDATIQKYDVVKCNHLIYAGEARTDAISACFDDVQKRYAEYLVPEIENVVMETTLSGFLFDPSFEDTVFEPMLDCTKEVLCLLFDDAPPDADAFELERIMLSAAKKGFALYCAKWFYRLYVQQYEGNKIEPSLLAPFAPINANDRAATLFGQAELLRSKIHDNEIDATHEDFDRMYEDMCDMAQLSSARMIDVWAKGVGRNDPCPCGSGKKYKKCCLQHQVKIPID